MAASAALARPSCASHHRHQRKLSTNSMLNRSGRDGSTNNSKHRDHHHERSRRHASCSDAATSSTSASSSSDGASSNTGCSQGSSCSDDHRRRQQRLTSKRKHHHHRDESSSDSDGSERSRKHRRMDISKKAKHRRKEGYKHKFENCKRKERSRKDSSGPVPLSKFLGRDKDNNVRRSVVSGKKIKMKVEKTKEDKLAETKRMELLKFLNSSYD